MHHWHGLSSRWRIKRLSKPRKGFKFRMEPTTREQDELLRMAGTDRFVWNWALVEPRRLPRSGPKGRKFLVSILRFFVALS